MKKNFLKTSIISALCMMGLGSVNALTGTVNSSDGINFRSSPSSSSSSNIITALKYNTKLTINSLDKYEGSGCDNGWYKATYNSKTGYVCSTYITVNTVTVDNSNYYTTSGYDARVSEDIISVKSTASYSSTTKDKLMYGESLKILKTAAKGNSCPDAWYQVSYRNNRTGYVCSTYVKKYTEVAVTNFTDKDTEYCNTLVSAGFPKSYCPYLVKLHNEHPTWNFTPVKTGLKWTSVISNEGGKNYISYLIDEPSYRVSDKLLDGGAWYELKDSVNAFYLDPRNFLNEQNIFMFQTLTFDEKTNTKENLAKVLSGTALNKDSIINAFITHGKTNNVSALHAASRVIQEGVTSSTHHGLSGKSTLTYRGLSLKGYYNLFNIGAWQDSYTTNPVARGLAYACGAISGTSTLKNCGYYKSYGRPWNTIESAINGGMNFLGEDYISVGQYTLYFQKFNTANSKIEGASPNYTHQYMTNIQAPISESVTMYGLYKDIKVLDSIDYEFSIPVYTSLPEEMTSLPPIGDAVNTLSSLKIDGDMVNGFDSDIIAYTKYVPYEKKSVKVTATPSSNVASVSGTGTIELKDLSTTIYITVTSETNEEKKYKITIIRTEESKMTIDELINKLDVRINENYIYITKPGTTASNLLNSISKQSATSTLNLVDKKGLYKTAGSLITSDKLTIKMLSGEAKTFNIIVLGDTNEDGKVDIRDLLKVQKHILNSKKLTGIAFESADTNLDNRVDIRDLLRVQKYILKSLKEFK